MAQRRSKQVLLSLLSQVMLIALVQQLALLAGTAANHALRVESSQPETTSDLVLLSPLQISDTDSGSTVTIAADQNFHAYSYRDIAGWLEVRIQRADARQVQSKFEGVGFAHGHTVQSGVDVVLLFALQPDAQAKVVPGVNHIEVDFAVSRRPDKLPLPVSRTETPSAALIPNAHRSIQLPQPSMLKLAEKIPTLAPTLLSEASSERTLQLIPIADAPPRPPGKNAHLPPPSLLNLATIMPTLAPGLSRDVGSKQSYVLAYVEAEPPPPAFPSSGATPSPTSDSVSTTGAPTQIQPSNVPLTFPPGIILAPRRKPQEKLKLNGVFTLSYSKTITHAEALDAQLAADKSRSGGSDFGLGLDLNLGTYVLDPRFLKLSLGASLFWDRGAYDDFDTSLKNTGANLYVDFLPTSPYPFRFHFTKQRNHLLEEQISSATTGRKSLGFDWSFRKPKLPTLTLSFDKTNYDSRFLASSGFKSKNRTLALNLADKFKGWDFNSNYSNQITTEDITNLNTDLNFLRFDARRQITKNSNLFISSYYQKLNFANNATSLGEDFSFFDLHTDFSSRLSQKLDIRFTHQFYYNTNRDKSLQGLISPAIPASAESISDSSLNQSPSAASTSTSEALLAAPAKSSTSFNAFAGEFTYRPLREITLDGSAGERLISPSDNSFENATRFTDFKVTVGWNRRVGSVDTRASYFEGLTYIRSNFGNSRKVEFHGYSAGFSMGSVKRAQVRADFNSSVRPDIFQIGGSFSQNYFDAGVESQALRGFQLRASVGENQLDYLTLNGREKFRHVTFSASLDNKLFTLLLSRNTSAGVRDIFLVPIFLDHRQMFIVLPLSNLIRDPLLNTAGAFTLGFLRLKPKKSLDVEVRYLKDSVLFVRTNDVFVKQLDLLANYRLGKFTFTGGAIFYVQTTEGLSSSQRAYYFFRIARPFNIF